MGTNPRSLQDPEKTLVTPPREGSHTGTLGRGQDPRTPEIGSKPFGGGNRTGGPFRQSLEVTPSARPTPGSPHPFSAAPEVPKVLFHTPVARSPPGGSGVGSLKKGWVTGGALRRGSQGRRAEEGGRRQAGLGPCPPREEGVSCRPRAIPEGPTETDSGG